MMDISTHINNAQNTCQLYFCCSGEPARADDGTSNWTGAKDGDAAAQLDQWITRETAR